ncbi:aminotransferase class I/II-fold pyridoxal phosphate-dependent enzyme [Patescibacteria group bacterium]|nr:aminotransferase class I/II-fold pyridoxal phosphate-dependent enzyme [Patescibacteria group bacterium]
MTKKVITTSLSPNITVRQVRTCLGFLFNPFKWGAWRKGACGDTLERSLEEYLHVPHVIRFDSGRAALYFALKAFGIGKGDEVLVQAYTCVSVPNAVLWASAHPKYVDIQDDFNVDPKQIEKHITEKTKAIIVQHTFGKPADMDAIVEIVKRYNLIIIEDVAHALGAEYKGKKVGSFGDAAIFSFGRDKVISGVSGGAVSCKDDSISKRVREYQESVPSFGRMATAKHLVYPPLFYLIKKTYSVVSFGKALAYIAKKLRITPLVLTDSEKCAVMPKDIFKKMPNALACLILEQFSSVDTINNDRRKKAQDYSEALKEVEGIILPREDVDEKHIFLRYTVLVKNGNELRKVAKENNIILGDWYSVAVAPPDTAFEKVFYTQGMCPNAEKRAAESVNLPSHADVSSSDMSKVIKIVKDYCSKNPL